jgi:hypothetical protein
LAFFFGLGFFFGGTAGASDFPAAGREPAENRCSLETVRGNSSRLPSPANTTQPPTRNRFDKSRRIRCWKADASNINSGPVQRRSIFVKA